MADHITHLHRAAVSNKDRVSVRTEYLRKMLVEMQLSPWITLAIGFVFGAVGYLFGHTSGL